MTSATANKSIPRPSNAQTNLDIVLGIQRVALSKLGTSELQALLASQLKPRDTRELYGFEELKSALRRKGHEPLEVSDAPTFVSLFPEEFPFNLKSHVVSVCRGCLYYSQLWRRYETGEETDDSKKASDWGNSAYLYRGTETLLFMRRMQENWSGADILAEVTYSYAKTQNKSEWVIKEISARPVPIEGFCRHYGKKAPEVAVHLLWELRDIFWRTADAMHSKAKRMREEADKREILAHRVG